MKFFRRKSKIKTVKGLLQYIYDNNYKSNSPFNVIQLRDDTNDIQIVHSGVLRNSGILKNSGLSGNNEFGFTILIPFDKSKAQFLEKFRNSKFIHEFSLLNKDETNEDYYCDCKLDIQLVEKICYEICLEIYDYNNHTKFKFRFLI